MSLPESLGGLALVDSSPVEFGELQASVLLFGGPYGNLEATQALLSAAHDLGIPPERTICTGDVAAYCADPEPTATLLRESGVPVVMGNCEESLAHFASACGCGFTEGSHCDLLAEKWYRYTSGQLSSETRQWMAGLPRRIDFRLGGLRFAVVHGSASRINQFVYGSTPAETKRVEFAQAGVDAILGGHGGLPFTQILEGRLWHNAGAIGLPANDGTPRTWFSVIGPEQEGVSITHHALDYDHGLSARKMAMAGLPEGYVTALSNGLWPSCDVLPSLETAQRGQRLELDGTRIVMATPGVSPSPGQDTPRESQVFGEHANRPAETVRTAGN